VKLVQADPRGLRVRPRRLKPGRDKKDVVLVSDWSLLIALFFFLLAAIAGIFGFSRLAFISSKIASVLFVVFFVLFLLVLIFGLFSVTSRPP